MEKNLKITYIQKVVNTLLHLRCCELIVKEILRGGEYEICPKTVEVESTKIYESSAGKKKWSNQSGKVKKQPKYPKNEKGIIMHGFKGACDVQLNALDNARRGMIKASTRSV